MTPEELEKLPKPLERTMTALEMDIMLEVVNRDPGMLPDHAGDRLAA